MAGLTAKAIEKAGAGSYSDGRGLVLRKRSKEGGAWFLRYQIDGKRRDLGIGAWPETTLAEAREKATELRKSVKLGIDPLGERERQKRQAQRAGDTLADMIDATFEALKPTLKGQGDAGRWMSPLRTHIIPQIGATPVTEIDGPLLRDTLRGAWKSAPEASKKALRRVGLALRHAAAEGRDVDLVAAERARLLLGAQVREVRHIPAMAWQDVPEFYQSLDGGTPVENALRLLVLTAVRSGSVRLATVDEFDLDAGIWIIPAANQKGRVGAVSDMRVPLSSEAVRVLQEVTEGKRGGDLLFAGKHAKALSDMAMSSLMKRRGLEARPHGFRASFRSWAAETGQDWAAAEMSLGHAIGSRIERTYARADLLDARRILLDRWAAHVTGETGQVVTLRG